MLCIGGVSQEDSKGALPLAARSGFNTPIADSNGKYKIDYFIDHGLPVEVEHKIMRSPEDASSGPAGCGEQHMKKVKLIIQFGSKKALDWKNKISSRMDSRGFTFVETLAALFVIMVGISSFVTLINQTVSYTKTSSYNLIAAYLGKEGIEIVKNIRDSNFLKAYYDIPAGSTWLDGLTSCQSGSGGCQIDYDSWTLTPYTGAMLKLPDTGSKFYNYSDGADTMFARRITIDPVGAGPDYLHVEVDVTWSEKGRSHVFPVQDNLYPGSW